MKKLLWLAAPVLIIVTIYSLSDGSSSEQYIADVLEQIEVRKRYLEFNESSPFKLFDKAYVAPQYFKIDPAFRVNARVKRLKGTEIISLGNSNGKSDRYRKFAWLTFTILDQPQKLLVLKPYGLSAGDVLFCAFVDQSSGESTYGGGRYLEINIGKSNKTIIDFNLAYNPYCAYVDDYSCPLPPPENILSVSIDAGEMAYEH